MARKLKRKTKSKHKRTKKAGLLKRKLRKKILLHGLSPRELKTYDKLVDHTYGFG